MYELKLGAIAVGAVIGTFLGGWNGLLYMLLVFAGFDYLTGVLYAIKTKSLSSNIGFWGLVKKALLLVVIGIGNLIDLNVIGEGSIFKNSVIFFFLANEGISLLENVGNLGVKYPEKLKEVLAQLRDGKENKKS